jgi:SAM-dependent methyltransferase
MRAAANVDRRHYARLQHDCPICCADTSERIQRVAQASCLRSVFLSRDEIAAELGERERFFSNRLDRRFSSGALRDVTTAALGHPAAILRCDDCGVLIREGVPDEELFTNDRYDERELSLLHRIHAAAFLAKEDDYRALLPPAARVVEVGSYAGGFLAAARQWGWSAIGTDIGAQTSRFCRTLGFDVRRMHLDECAFEDNSLEGVFVWNCFEQLSDGASLIEESQRILRTGGLLVIRVPDAERYLDWERAWRLAHDEVALAALAYNGILGWPHRFGYGETTLRSLVERRAFRFELTLRRRVISPLHDALNAKVRKEVAGLMTDDRKGWIELAFRRSP